MIPKMILRLGFVDLYHKAISILVRHVVLFELSEPYGRAHPEFSHISHSQCKLQVVCCRERLHVTVFGKIASLSLERASTYTNILYFDRRFQVFLYGAILGFRQIAWSFNTACLPLLRLFLPGSNPFLKMEFNSFAFPT